MVLRGRHRRPTNERACAFKFPPPTGVLPRSCPGGDPPEATTATARRHGTMSHQFTYSALLEDFAEIEARLRRIEPFFILCSRSPTAT